MAETIQLFAKEMNDLLRGQKGPVFRHIISTAEKVRVRAKELVGKDTHQLEHSIVKRFVSINGEVGAEIGSPLNYALVHHEDAAPHMIFPRKAKVLRFTVGGETVFAAFVNHPGHKGTHYLTRALKEIVR